jgi:hypothetical protein
MGNVSLKNFCWKCYLNDHDDLKKDLDTFRDSKETYDKYGIRYKRTYLFFRRSHM